MNHPTKTTVDFKSFRGRTLHGGYLLEEYIAEGNFGAVFRSHQLFLDYPAYRVALKLSKQTGLDSDTAKELFSDAFILARAIDEIPDLTARGHLVRVFQVGIAPELDRRGYMAMEYVQGTTLADQFESYGRVPANLLLKWMRQACLALSALHDLVPPLLHCDLKPDNILLGTDLAVRLVDFGLSARLLESGFVPDVRGVLKYMSPETSQGESFPASDVYSLGVVMYEGLTGRRPYDHLVPGPGLPDALYSEWFYEQRNQVRPIPPSSLNPSVSPQFDSLILRCLEFSPSERFRNAAELLKDLKCVDKPAGLPLDQTALNEAKQLERDGHPTEAIAALRRVLSQGNLAGDKRFHVLRDLAKLLASQDKHGEAADTLVRAWDLAKDSAILRSRRDRAELLSQVAEAYERAGNPFQAVRYRSWSADEYPQR